MATLTAFEAAARHRSFTRAAEELSLSPASISRRVRELEEFVGVSLFERRRHDVELTKRGQEFASSVQPALRELAFATDRLRDTGAELGRLTMFTDISIAQAIVAPKIGAFQRQFPDLHIRLSSSSEPIDVIREEFDIGFQYGRHAEHLYDITPLADEALFPVCSPEMAATLPAHPTPERVAELPLLHFSEHGRSWPGWRQFFKGFDVTVAESDDGMTFSSYQICLEVAEKGEGVALGWARVVTPRLEAGRLMRIPGMTLNLPDAINIYRPKKRDTNTYADEFVQLLRREMDSIT